jgi:hypothetical protein
MACDRCRDDNEGIRVEARGNVIEGEVIWSRMMGGSKGKRRLVESDMARCVDAAGGAI